MAHTALLESPHITTQTNPLKTCTSSSENAYILAIASTPNFYAASASAPSNVIDLFDKNTLRGITSLPGHTNGTTSLKAVDAIAGLGRRSLVSSGKDGSVKVWDERAGTFCIQMTDAGKSRAILCCDVSPDGLTVAAGTEFQGDDAYILYWDPRRPSAPIRTHSSTHSDDITSLSFSPISFKPSTEPSAHSLLSVSSDGLVSLSNPLEDDEDEAVLNVGNWGCSISQAGWIAPGSKVRIWAGSDMETFSTWSDEADSLLTLDIREPSVHSAARTWVTDYLIGCHTFSPSSSTSKSATALNNLGIFVGSNEGDVALLSNMNPSVADAPWCVHRLWTNGHVGVVRSMLWDEENNTLLTGGEDCKLNAWSCPPIAPITPSGDDGDSAMDVDSPPRKRDLDDGDGAKVCCGYV
ncbi:WD40-repeat-containing domain protein [Crucibulum laeve]|uniref:WD40-repeat-containing domain protein n=1 Tax=Crucibulum laeve TaxID=68775 RepID=A0A5C3MED3_9AGAR|nr:WD40-repeat-containing domain protein [Crucibulum laeve]